MFSSPIMHIVLTRDMFVLRATISMRRHEMAGRDPCSGTRHDMQIVPTMSTVSPLI